jgi:Fe-S-cluster-containing hydrogenase component 2
VLRPEVDWYSCQACEPCEARIVCRTRALVRIDPGEPMFVELARCNGCSKCVIACPYDAIVMRDNTDRII